MNPLVEAYDNTIAKYQARMDEVNTLEAFDALSKNLKAEMSREFHTIAISTTDEELRNNALSLREAWEQGLKTTVYLEIKKMRRG